MNEVSRKLTLTDPATYQIKVPGHLDASWSEWGDRMTITLENEGDGPPATTLTGTLDQAALQGLLRRLYSLGCAIDFGCLDHGGMMRQFSTVKGMHKRQDSKTQ